MSPSNCNHFIITICVFSVTKDLRIRRGIGLDIWPLLISVCQRVHTLVRSKSYVVLQAPPPPPPPRREGPGRTIMHFVSLSPTCIYSSIPCIYTIRVVHSHMYVQLLPTTLYARPFGVVFVMNYRPFIHYNTRKQPAGWLHSGGY